MDDTFKYYAFGGSFSWRICGMFIGISRAQSKKVSMKAVITLLGSALGGAPILFMKDLTYEKWMYPVGLVIGMLWVRMLGMRGMKNVKGNLRGFTGLMMWVDMIAIALFSGIVIVCATFIRVK